MIILISFAISVLCFWLAVKRAKPHCKPSRTAAEKKRAEQARIKLEQAERKRAEQEEKERQRREKALAKEQEQREKARQKREQAEADLIFIRQQLETAGDMLLTAQEAVNGINAQIEIDRNLRSYDSEKKHRKQLEQAQKKLLTAENRLHNLESKLAKCYYVIKKGENDNVYGNF